MRSWTTPTPEQIEKVKAMGVRSENRTYFFDHLENPKWVMPLADAGFFREAPEAETLDEDQIRFPPWPEGRYLTRVASIDPKAVSQVLRQMTTSSNPAVTRLQFTAAVELPDSAIVDLADKIVELCQAPHLNYFAEDAAAAIGRLAVAATESSELNRAFKAAKSLLDIHESSSIQDLGISRVRDRATSRISPWLYGRVIDALLPVLVDKAGLEGVAFFLSILYKAMLMDCANDAGMEDSRSDQHSYIWRRRIGSDSEHGRPELRQILVSALRDASLRYASLGDGATEAVVLRLENSSQLFRRIALHVLANTTFGRELVSERIGSRILFDAFQVRNEYHEFIRARFGDANPMAQDTFLRWIEDGPDMESYRDRRTRWVNNPDDGDAAQQYQKRWQVRHYRLVADHLSGEHADRYASLLEEFGDSGAVSPDDEDIPAARVIPVVGPLSEEELAERSPLEIIDFLRNWEPPAVQSWDEEVSIEGLGKTFQQIVRRNPEHYSTIAQHLVDVDPTYVRHYFEALKAAVGNGEAISWREVLELAHHVLNAPFEKEPENHPWNRDPGWSWCRRSISSLLEAGLRDGESKISLDLRKDVWKILKRLTEDSDPSPHDERRQLNGLDYHTLSINANRPVAMHTVIQYALWYRRESDALEAMAMRDGSLMPEVRELLERHLDLEHECSLAVRSVYGRWLPWLQFLDGEWTKSNLDKIFPLEPESEELRDVAWATYIVWCPAFDPAYEMLEREYHHAISRVTAHDRVNVRREEDIDLHLGEHLITFYWRGVIGLSVFEAFLSRAADDLIGQVMWYLGDALQNTAETIPSEVLVRIRTLWEARFEIIEQAGVDHIQEARSFGYTFSSRKMEDAWATDMFERLQSVPGVRGTPNAAIERLAEIAADEPDIAVRLFARALNQAENDWDYISWRDAAVQIVISSEASTQDDARECRQDIIDFYIKHGELDFRSYVQSRRQ